jgi:predicted nucleic acid-binding Zn ribbon protein
MPTYVFKCAKCGNMLEQMMSLGEYAQNPFPLCMEEGCDGQQKMKVQLQPVGFILKGTGWTPKYAGGAGEGPSTDLAMPKKRTTARRRK